jgi:DNA end-binding protein Ku
MKKTALWRVPFVEAIWELQFPMARDGLMARSIWNGMISFGLVSIPVGLQSATQEKDIRFNQLHRPCGSRIKQQRFCPTCERVVETEEIDRGFEVAKNQYVIVTDEDFENLPVPSRHTIEVLAFIHRDQIDPIYFDQTYYLDPGETGRKPFALLVKALQEKEVCALGKIAIRNKENLCLLRPAFGTLVCETLHYPDEIRRAESPGLESVVVDDRELAMAKSLVDLLADEFHPEKFSDGYRTALMERIEAKQHGGELKVSAETEAPQVVNLMDALRASLELAQKAKSG